MILIYVPKITPRIEYIFTWIFSEVLELKTILTEDIESFTLDPISIKIEYNYIPVSSYLFYPCHDLLFEDNIKTQRIEEIICNNFTALFRPKEIVESKNFDLFASAFYLISRYEEYFPCMKDNHNRYLPEQSVAFRFNFLNKAMVNRYIDAIQENLTTFYPEYSKKNIQAKSLYTLDIDHAFYAKNVRLEKFLKRNILTLFQAEEKDKYDTYDFIYTTLNQNKVEHKTFLLCPENPHKNDHFNKREDEAFIELTKILNNKTDLNIHPSYNSLNQKNIIEEEKNWLEKKIDKKIESSRFHFLRFDIEFFYASTLLKNHIQSDFSMTYGYYAGFRSSTSLPFYFFDLTNNSKTLLKIYTPCFMDSTFEYYATSDEHKYIQAKDSYTFLQEEIKNYGGIFIPIFHNDLMAKKEWKSIFEQSLKSTPCE
jgi:hypothetical protein